MKATIVVASQKGGVGKSTIITNLAAGIASLHKRVILVDADEQPTSSEWGAGRAHYPDAAPIEFIQQYGEINAYLDGIDTDYLLVDTAGHASIEMRSSMLSADILLLPFKPSQADLNTIAYMSNVVRQAKWLNEKLIALAFINQAPTQPNMSNVQDAQAMIAEYPEFSLLDAIIYNRDVYQSSIATGLGVVEMGGKSASERKAKDEIEKLTSEVLSWAK